MHTGTNRCTKVLIKKKETIFTLLPSYSNTSSETSSYATDSVVPSAVSSS